MQEREQQNCFWERQQEPRKVALETLMITYVSLVAKSSENLWKLIVNLIQVFRAVLRYF
jgi:hypothetical protein